MDLRSDFYLIMFRYLKKIKRKRLKREKIEANNQAEAMKNNISRD